MRNLKVGMKLKARPYPGREIITNKYYRIVHLSVTGIRMRLESFDHSFSKSTIFTYFYEPKCDLNKNIKIL